MSLLLPAPILTAIRGLVSQVMVGSAGPGAALDYDHPQDDPGLFGPDSVTWRIHADFPGMMAGGLCALMLQLLHPRALAGVWDHSDFRNDLLGRLRRTTVYVAATTYAPRAVAEAQIQRVRTIHRKVRGRTADGRPYRAGNPDLLTWVHVTEMWSFLQGFQRYRGPVDARLQDRYFDETARLAQALGAKNVPRSRAAIDDYFQAVRPELRFDERSAEVLRVLEAAPLPTRLAPAVRPLFLGSGAALLPAWAVEALGRNSRRQALDASAAHALRLAAPAIRQSLSEGVAARSCRRMGVSPAILDQMPLMSDRPVLVFRRRNRRDGRSEA